MLGLSEKTEIKKHLPKEQLYRSFPKELKGEKRNRFDADISRIIITNEISPKTINIDKGDKINSIFVIQLMLKRLNYNDKNIDLIFRLFKQSVVLVLLYENKKKIIVKFGLNIESEWLDENEFNMKISGLNMDTVYENIVKQVGNIIIEGNNSLEEQIYINEEKKKFLKKIEFLEKRAWNERQPRKKLEIVNRIKVLKNELD